MHSDPGPDGVRADADLVERAREQSIHLPGSICDQVLGFKASPPPGGCLLLKGLPVGELPPTPASPMAASTASAATELRLLTIAVLLGEAVGYSPEHGGHVVQNIVPVQTSAATQTSTSSTVDLMLHTEAAFHPHRPRHLLLFCLRGDPKAVTTVASIHGAFATLDPDVIEVLFQKRFRCAVDESFLHGRANVLGPPMAVLSGTVADPVLVFDQDLMVGVDEEAEDALGDLARALGRRQHGVVLESGDLLVIDNRLVVHGRSPFEPRFDGTDRWLQRAFVIADLGPNADERTGRVITTTFGE